MARELSGAVGRDVSKPLRVVLTGPESTGKSTVAAALAAEFGVPWTREAARLYAEHSPGPLSAATVDPIARLSMQLEDELLAAQPTLALLVRDTDLLSTVVYARHYYGNVSPWILDDARARLADLYLLCQPNVPWEPDGVRDRPISRVELFDEFQATLTEFGANVVTLTRTGAARVTEAISAVEALRRGA